MNEENNEYEYDATTENASDTPLAMPEGVLERMQKHAERTGDKLPDVIKHFLSFIESEHSCEDWMEEDEDLLIDWAEQCFIQLRRSTVGGGANTVPFVGCFVGVDAKKTDRRGGMVSRASREYAMNNKEAIDNGVVGEYFEQGNFWAIRTANGVVDTNDPVEEEPSMGLRVDGKYICLMGRTTGRPMYPSLLGRNYYFLGNHENEFDKDIKLWRVDALGDSSDMHVKVGEPCRIQVRPPNPDAAEAFRDVLGTGIGFHENIEYTTNFVDEDEVKFLHPHKFLASDLFHQLYVPLESLSNACATGSRTFEINGETGRAGPIVFTKGSVSRLSTEGRESQYDETGRNFSLNLTNISLQSEYGEKPQAEVSCWISGACYDSTNPFVARKGDEEIPWAEKSSIIVIGRIGMSVRDGVESPKMNVFGIYADPRRIRKRTEGGNTNMSQFIGEESKSKDEEDKQE